MFWPPVLSIPFFLFALDKARWDNTPNSLTARWVAFGIGLLFVSMFFQTDWFKQFRYRRDAFAAARRAQRVKDRAEKKRLKQWQSFHLPDDTELCDQFLAPYTGFERMLNSDRAADVSAEYALTYPHLPLGTVDQAKAQYKLYWDRFKPLRFKQDTRYAGTWIVAPPGRGKTNLLHNLIAADRKRGTVVLMDSKGDLINAYRGLPNAIVIDPKEITLNPLQLGSSIRSLEFLEYIFSSLLDVNMTGLQKTLFSAILEVLQHTPQATIETFRDILNNGIDAYHDPLTRCTPDTRAFFTAGKPTDYNSPTYRDTKDQLKWRLRLLLRNDCLRRIFSSPTSSISFFSLLDSRQLIIIDNSKDELGEDGAEFFGRFFVAVIWMAAVSRSRQRQEDKVPVFFYIDEAHTVIRRDTKITTILDECRSQKIALIMAHQRIGQIDANVIDALNNCAVRLANSDDDAEALAKRFRIEAAALRLPIGQFACFVRDTTPQAVTISVPLFETSHFPPPAPKAPPPAPQRTTEPFKPVLVPKDDDLDFG